MFCWTPYHKQTPKYVLGYLNILFMILVMISQQTFKIDMIRKRLCVLKTFWMLDYARFTERQQHKSVTNTSHWLHIGVPSLNLHLCQPPPSSHEMGHLDRSHLHHLAFQLRSWPGQKSQTQRMAADAPLLPCWVKARWQGFPLPPSLTPFGTALLLHRTVRLKEEHCL